MYHTDAVFINGKDYTHYNADSLQTTMKMKLCFPVLLKFPRLEYKIIFNILHIKMNSIRILSLCHDYKNNNNNNNNMSLLIVETHSI